MSEKIKIIKARLNAWLLLKREPLRCRLTRGMGLVLLARYAWLPIFMYCHEMWRNWLYSSQNPDIWMRPLMAAVMVCVFCLAYGVVILAPALAALFKQEFVKDFDAMSGMAEILGGVGSVLLPIGFFGIFLPASIRHRNWFCAVSAVLAGIASLVDILLIYSVIRSLPFAMPSWFPVATYFALPICAFATIVAISDGASLRAGLAVPFLVAAVLVFSGNQFRKLEANNLDEDVNMIQLLPEEWQPDALVTLMIMDAMAEDAHLWYQLVNRKQGDRSPLVTVPHPSRGPADFNFQIRREGKFVRKFMAELCRINTMENMSAEAKVNHFSDRQWLGRYNGFPTADSLASGMIMLLVEDE